MIASNCKLEDQSEQAWELFISAASSDTAHCVHAWTACTSVKYYNRGEGIHSGRKENITVTLQNFTTKGSVTASFC